MNDECKQRSECGRKGVGHSAFIIHHSSSGVQRGTVLIVTLWVIVVLAALVVVLARSMRVEGSCSANGVAAMQAEAVEQGAIQYVLAHVDALYGAVPTLTDAPAEAVQVGTGTFWILNPNGDGQTCSFGIVDEASKLNLNTASPEMLQYLPGMTAELAACVVDWRDADSDATPGGAESEYYLLLDNPYECKNAPLETVEELLLVKGMTQQVLFGEDTNRNGVLDGNENDDAATEPPDNADGHLDRGVYDFVTVYTSEPSTSASGDARINVNEPSGSELSDLLRPVVAQDRIAVVLDRARRERPFRSLLDFYVRTAMTAKEFAQVADRLATDTNPITGLVNVNTATSQVLACLPGLTDADVSTLLSWRSDTSHDISTVAWLAEALPPDRMARLAAEAAVTTRSYQFSADIVAISGDGRAFRRCRVVVDASASPPKVLYRQDLTHLGWPLEPEIMAGLRSGTSLDQSLQKPLMGVR